MQTSLVAGGAGFIGSHLCERLLKENHKVICVDNYLTSNKENLAQLMDNANFVFVQQDVTNPLSIDEKVNFVFHLASPASPNHHSSISYHSLPLETMLVNTTGTLNLLEFAKKNNARFLFASTSEVYGDPLEHPQKETYRGNVSSTGPRSVYDESKRFGETLTAYFERSKGLDTRIARIFNTYGSRMLKEDKRMIVSFINEALKGEPIVIFGDGTNTRSLCFVDDTVDGLVKLMFAENAKGEIINIGSVEERTVLEYADLVKKLTNSNSSIVHEELPVDDPKQRRPDISKAKSYLGWEPHVKIEDGLLETIEYFKSV